MTKNTENKNSASQESKFVFDEYRNLNNYRKIPINNVWIDRLAKDLCEWIKNDTKAVNFGPFLLEKGMLPTEFKRLRDKHPGLEAAYRFVLHELGMRRDAGATERRYDASYVFKTMPIFSEEFKELVKWHTKIKAEEEESKKNITVIMQPYPDSGVVPPQKKESDNREE